MDKSALDKEGLQRIMGIVINLTCTAATVRSHMRPLWSGRGMETSGEAAETGDGPVLERVD